MVEVADKFYIEYGIKKNQSSFAKVNKFLQKLADDTSDMFFTINKAVS